MWCLADIRNLCIGLDFLALEHGLFCIRAEQGLDVVIKIRKKKGNSWDCRRGMKP